MGDFLSKILLGPDLDKNHKKEGIFPLPVPSPSPPGRGEGGEAEGTGRGKTCLGTLSGDLSGGLPLRGTFPPPPSSPRSVGGRGKSLSGDLSGGLPLRGTFSPPLLLDIVTFSRPSHNRVDRHNDTQAPRWEKGLSGDPVWGPFRGTSPAGNFSPSPLLPPLRRGKGEKPVWGPFRGTSPAGNLFPTSPLGYRHFLTTLTQSGRST